MSFRAARNLQIAAVVLFAFILLFTLVFSLVQEPFKRLIPNNESVIGYHATPTLRIVTGVINLAVAVVYLLLLNRRSSPLRGPIIAIAVLCGLSTLLIIPASTIESAYMAFISSTVESETPVRAHAFLEGWLKVFVTPFACTGAMLMLLSMGGAFGRCRSADQTPGKNAGWQNDIGG